MVSVQTSRAEYALKSFRTSLDLHDRLFLERPIAFESLVYQLPLIV